MTKRQRTLLFSSLLGLFFILAPSFALYSQGYRIDFQGARIAKTGAFYFKVAPSRADVFIDGNLMKKTDFLFGSLLTKNFFPESYFVEIVKEGYHSWQKILTIEEQQVTEAKNILLFKKNPAFQKLADGVLHFWISPSKQYAILEKAGEKKMQLLNLETGGTEPLKREAHKGDKIINITWAKDSRRFLLRATSKEQLIYEVWNISNNKPCFLIPCSLTYLGEDIGNVQFSPTSPEEVLFTKFLNTTQVLLTAPYIEQEIATPIANNIVAFTSYGDFIFWLASDGTLWQKDSNGGSAPQIFQESAFLPKKETDYELKVVGDAILVKEDTTLFLHKRGDLKRREILSPVFEFAIDSGGTKVALYNQSELWVLFLKEETEQPQHNAGELTLLTRFAQSPKQITWIDSSYLLFSLENILRNVEIDIRGSLNVVDIASFPSPEFFWNNEKGTLYILSKGAFSVSEQLVR
ncbi:MAG: hypothetical protein O3C23_00365 [bacterium]|nr:hypothetical protein [bacterium]